MSFLGCQADEWQRLSRGAVVPFGVYGEWNGECNHPVADSLLKALRQVVPEGLQKFLHNLSALLGQGGNIFFGGFHGVNFSTTKNGGVLLQVLAEFYYK